MIVTKVNSKALRGSTELIVVADIKPGLVQIADPMSYATRLERFLDALFQQRKRSVEFLGSGFVGPLERLRTLHFVHFGLIEERRKLLLVVDFDKPWEPYIRTIVDDAGPILDAIFFHCVGYEQSTSRHGYVAFANWVRERQQNTNFFFAGVPEMSSDDARYYANLKELHDTGAPNPADYALNARVGEPATPGGVPEFLRTMAGLYRLKGSFPERGEAFDRNANDPEYTDRAIYNRVVRLVAQSYAPAVQAQSTLLANQYNDFGPWFASVTQAPIPPQPAAPQAPPLNELQGNILNGYTDMTHGVALLVHFAGRGAQFLNTIRVTTDADAAAAPNSPKCNVGFTFAGLKALGLPKQTLDQLPVEFREGMAERAGPLGDVATNHPETWSPPKDVIGATDAVVILELQDTTASDDGTTVHPTLQAQITQLEAIGIVVLYRQPLRRYAARRDPQTRKYREHFGYLDGFGQPVVHPNPNLAVGPNDNRIGFGEVLLGYPNDHLDQPGDLEQSPLFRNGSFLVVRQLAQDVQTFERFVADSAAATALPAATIMAKLMGREPNGLPQAAGTTQATIGADWNTFDYGADQAGTGCPFQSHVRLSNPRSPNEASVHARPKRVPRMTRRGFSYGPNDSSGERGLLFMAYVANIAEQFEVVQRWLNGANSTGLHSSQNDPITAPVEANRAPFRFATAAGRTVTLPAITQPFVTLRWGLYLFVPSTTGLVALVNAAANPENPGRAALVGGREILSRLRDLETKLPANIVALEWKKILEGQGQGDREKGVALMATIRIDQGGVIKSPYGVIVGSERIALEVLKDETRFSAREYWRRMRSASIRMHLGMDQVPVQRTVCPPLAYGQPPSDQHFVHDVGPGEYARESFANDLVYGIDRVTAFRGAYALTRAALNVPPPVAGRRTADLFVAAERIVASLSQAWFGFPDGTATPGNVGLHIGGTPVNDGDVAAYCPSDFVVASQYIFRQTPDPWTEQLGVMRGARIHAAALAHVRANPSPTAGTFLAALYRESNRLSPGLSPADREAQIVRSLVGAIDGFVAANWGAFVSTIGQWTTKGDLWRNQLAFANDIRTLAQLATAANSEYANTGAVSQQTRDALDPAIADTARFVESVAQALRIVPLPMWLVRTAITDTTLGAVSVRAGDRIAIHLGSAALENRSVDMLFGGRFDPSGTKGAGPTDLPHHACPAKNIGIGVLLGMLVATLERTNIIAQSPITLSYDP